MSGWELLLAAARAPEAALRRALADAGAAQAHWLSAHLARQAATQFGRAHGFARLRSLADYRAAVPVAPYAAFAPAIAAMAAGEAGVLVAEPVVAFEETGGTAAGAKLVPYTQASLTAFAAAVLPWLADLARRRPAVIAGRAYVAVSPATRPARLTPGGAPVGLPEAAYLGAGLAGALAALMAVPAAVGAIDAVEAWRLATLSALVEAEDLSFVSVWSPTFFLDLVEALPAHGAAMMPGLSPPARRRLAAALGDGAGAVDTTRLWPRLAAVSCWTDAGAAPFARRLAALCPQAALEPKGLLATEAAVTLPLGAGEGGLPALTSGLIEFMAADGSAHLADTLEAGMEVEVALTTPGGFYRYAIGDRLACIGRDGLGPRLRFLGRAGLVSDLVGEKLDEAFVATVLAALPVAAALVARAGARPPHYELWLDLRHEVAAGVADGLAAAVESGLAVNPQYAHARRIGQLGPLRAVARPGFATARAERRARAGARLGDQKPAALIPAGAEA